MKIGIISMQRVVNCGSFLQAYGLKKIIESLGNEVVFIDYHVEKPLFKTKEDVSIYRKNVIKNFILNSLSKCSFLFPLLPEEIGYSVKDRHCYETIYFKQLGLSKKKEYNTQVDTVVIGSDEVFNCLQLNPEVGFSPELFGKDNNSKRLITYAASFGNTTYEEILSSGKRDEIAGYLKRMNAISARDNNTADLVEKLTGNRPVHNLDPVLMYGFKDEIPDLEIEEPYILVYAYRRRIRSEEAEAIRAFADERKMRLVSVGGYQPFCDVNLMKSPYEVLGYFKKAQYVFTDTFHGTIFSIINHRKFVTFVREGHGKNYGNSEKMNGLLMDLNLTERALSDLSEINKIENEIDYVAVERLLEHEREKTIGYLKDNLHD